MDSEAIENVLDELLPYLEVLETQSAAILLFLKDKGIATEQQLAPYLKQAGDASTVRCRAARVRIARVLTSAIRDAEKAEAESKEQSAAIEKQVEQRSSKHVENEPVVEAGQDVGSAQPREIEAGQSRRAEEIKAGSNSGISDKHEQLDKHEEDKHEEKEKNAA